MPFEHQFPYTNLHDLNIDWILETMRKLEKVYEEVPSDLQQFVNNWLDAHPEATSTVQDGSVTKQKLAPDVSASYILIPDEFTGTDSEKLQACFDLLKDSGGIVCINRTYSLTADIFCKSNSSNDAPIYFLGLGQASKINCNAYTIRGDIELTEFPGNVYFDNIFFTGTGHCFDGDTILRIYFSNCYFTSFIRVFNSINGHARGGLQTIYVSNCVFRRCGIAFYADGWAADIHIVNNNFEWGESVFISTGNSNLTGVYIENNLAEGLRGYIARIRNGRSVVIDGNRFESNYGYIDCDDPANISVIITNNMSSGDNNKPFVLLPSTGSNLWTAKYNNRIEGNFMAWLLQPIIGFANTPTGFIKWTVKNNYANDIPAQYKFLLNEGEGINGFGVETVDFDTCYGPGLYINTRTALHNPTGANTHGNLLVTRGAGEYITQQYTPIEENYQNKRYERTGRATYTNGQINVTWTPWNVFITDRITSHNYPYTENEITFPSGTKTYLIIIQFYNRVQVDFLSTFQTTGTVTNIIPATGLDAPTFNDGVLTIPQLTGLTSAKIVTIVDLNSIT